MSRNLKLDEESIKNTLQSILAEIQETDDPEELNEFRAIFRKNVPLFHRAYVAAWLIRKLVPSSVVENTGSRKTPAVPREGMTTLFIGIGRSRRVFPRDLMGILVEKTGIAKEQIGTIKILDNYSFVDIANDKCPEVIEKLNNLEFRGRALAVNFAKKKD